MGHLGLLRLRNGRFLPFQKTEDYKLLTEDTILDFQMMIKEWTSPWSRQNLLTRFFRPKFKLRDFIWKAKQNFQSKNKSQSSAVQAVTSPQILDLWHRNTVLAPRINFFYFNHWKVRSFAFPAYYNVTRGSIS